MSEEHSHHRSGRPAEPGREPGRRRTLVQSQGSRAVLGFMLRFVLCWGVALALAALFPRIEQWAIAATMWSLRIVLLPLGEGARIAGSMVNVGGA